jgi:hypothetical protein
VELVVVLAVVIFVSVVLRVGRRSRSFQTPGEAAVSTALMRRFSPPDYHLLNHLTLRVGTETTQIDHVLVSRFGVFVIEAKNYNGWIFGSEGSRHWTQVFYRVRFKFQNPLRQNYKHVCAVRELLDFLPPETVRSVVVFTGSARLKTPVPENVLTLDQLAGYVQRHGDSVMSVNRLQFCVGRLETSRLAITRETDVEHVERLRKKYGGH